VNSDGLIQGSRRGEREREKMTCCRVDRSAERAKSCDKSSQSETMSGKSSHESLNEMRV
jgi:hypothetical protein